MKWWLCPSLGALAIIGYFLTPGGVASETVFVAVGAISVIVVVIGIRFGRPVSTTAWMLIAAGTGLWVLGDAAFTAIAWGDDSAPATTGADVVYLLGYPVLAVGLYLLVHQGWRRGDLGHVANSAIVMIAFGLPMWVFVLRADTVDVPVQGALVLAAYPAMDVFMVGLLVHFIGTPQWKNISFRLLTGALVLVLVADTADNLTSIATTTTGHSFLDAGYLSSYVLIATAAVHPSMRTLAPPPVRSSASIVAASFSFPTVLVLAAATLTAPIVTAFLIARGEPASEWGWSVVLCSTLLVVLVSVRVGELLMLLHRQTDELLVVAETDHLTGLRNRRGLEAWVDGGRRPLSILLLDIDRFAEINDTFGHAVGDDILRVIADRLRRTVGDDGIVGRLGADEFFVAFHAEQAVAVDTAHRLHEALRRPVSLHRTTLLVEASIGVAGSSDTVVDTVKLLRQASLASQRAKAVQPRVASYEASMERDNSVQLLLLSELTTAIDHRQLELFYQVQVDLVGMKTTGVEALLRWNHPTRGVLDPDLFLPTAERTGLVRPLLDYVLDESLTQRQRWHSQGLDLTMSINISTRNLLDAGLVDQVRDALRRSGTEPEDLTVELTETAPMTDPPRAIASLERLRGLGISLAIDDFGTGYSSLSYLQRLPVQQLKIDKSLVTDMSTEPSHRIIVHSTIDLARTLGLSVTAEGVEHTETLMTLKRLSCHFAQGYALGHPMPAAEVPAAVAEIDAELKEIALHS